MSIIGSTFEELKNNNSRALVTYTVAGDPDLKESEKIIENIISSGADIIEIGVPFSDPMSEGPVIQLSHEGSLKNKTSLEEILKLSIWLKKKFNKTPIVLMGYFNTFINSLEIAKGNHDINDDICRELKNHGVDGLIIVDLPFEESEEIFNKLTKFDIDLIRLISPTTNDLKETAFFKRTWIKKYSRIPVVVGFGIKDKKPAKKMSVFSDGVVVGSAIVDIISNKQDLPFQDIFSQISKFVEGIKSSIQ